MKYIPVFYDKHMDAPVAQSSPSAQKPGKVVTAWLKAKLPIDVFSPTPPAQIDLRLAHSRTMVNDIMNGKAPNGFGTSSVEVARTFPWTVGAMVNAAFAANRIGVACAPVSGFHHARWDEPGGFCTFNGLVVAARRFHNTRGGNVAILDCDQHYGNGTVDIIDHLKLDFIRHFTVGGDPRFGRPDRADAFLTRLPEWIAAFVREGCKLLIYQAGADPHIKDPLGGWLTTAQLHQRDRIVFETCRKEGLPVAWNLAGGYQKPFSKVIEIHMNTMKACAEVFT